jgi:hypothetical protein
MVLDFDKPKKVRSTDEHNQMHVADCAPPGVYVPNMSVNDRRKWKAKQIGGSNPRVEIRKSFHGLKVGIEHPYHKQIMRWSGDYSSETVIVVRRDGVIISMNGRTGITNEDFDDLVAAVEEARAMLR